MHCILWHFKISLAQIFYQQIHISRARNCPRVYTTREKYFYLECPCICNCCVYNVGVFHCLVLRLAMWHSCVSVNRYMVSPFFKWHPGCSPACRIPEMCVRVTFFLILSGLRALHSVAFKISLAQIFYQQIHISRARKCPRVYTTREKYFYLESPCMCNCCVYNVGVFHCLVLRLAM